MYKFSLVSVSHLVELPWYIQLRHGGGLLVYNLDGCLHHVCLCKRIILLIKVFATVGNGSADVPWLLCLI